jgi:hypothetical protein
LAPFYRRFAGEEGLGLEAQVRPGENDEGHAGEDETGGGFFGLVNVVPAGAANPFKS